MQAAAVERLAKGNFDRSIAIPTRLDDARFLPRKTERGLQSGGARARVDDDVAIAWRVVRQSATGYEISDRSMLDLASPGRSTRLTSDTGADVARARQTRAGQVYFEFARFPIARVAAGPQSSTVRLFDARFIGLPANDALDGMSANLSIRITLASPDRAVE